MGLILVGGMSCGRVLSGLDATERGWDYSMWLALAAAIVTNNGVLAVFGGNAVRRLHVHEVGRLNKYVGAVLVGVGEWLGGAQRVGLTITGLGISGVIPLAPVAGLVVPGAPSWMIGARGRAPAVADCLRRAPGVRAAVQCGVRRAESCAVWRQGSQDALGGGVNSNWHSLCPLVGTDIWHMNV